MENKDQPAYPALDTTSIGGQPALELKHEGLTKRELIAAMMQPEPNNYTIETMEKIMGSTLPDFTKDPIGNIIWYAELDAKLKIIKADALLKQLE